MAEPRDLEQWTTDLVSALGLDTRGLDRAVDIAGVLDLARVAAHGVARPAAPLTTFLAGYALATGATLEQVADVVARLAGGGAEAEAEAGPGAEAGAEAVAGAETEPR